MDTPEAPVPQEHVTLGSYLKQVSKALKQAMPDSTWVVAELSDFKVRPNGHVYMDVIETEGGKEVAKAKVSMFSTVSRKVLAEWERVTGGLPAAGMKVLLKVRADLSPQYGFTLNATGLDPSYTLGDMQAKLQEMISFLKSKGWFDLQRMQPSPTGHWRIAVISPHEAAGLADFRRDAQMLADAGVCLFDYFSATFQGKATSESIRDAMKAVHECHKQEPYDAVVIIRGGGSKADLAHLNDVNLGAWVCRLPIPIYTGIGHEIDECLLDMVAHRKFDTPSKVIAFIRSSLVAEATQLRQGLHSGKAMMLALAAQERPLLERRWGEFARHVRNLTHRQHQAAMQAKGRVDIAIGKLLSGHRLHLQRRAGDLTRLGHSLCVAQRQHVLLATSRAKSQSLALVTREKGALAMACMLYDKTNPLALLGRGFALVRGPSGEIITSALQARDVRKLDLAFADGHVTAVAAESETNNVESTT